jgi:glycosyltransferase involved in cell wall biosynthesis
MMPSKQLSIALVHPRIGRGGSEALVMWGAEALKREFEVSIVTTNAIDLRALNSFYGTDVSAREVTLLQVPIPRIVSGIRGAAAIRGALFQRAMHRSARNYDVLISTYNLCDFGVPAIHLLDLSWDEELRTRFSVAPTGIEGMFHRVAPVRAMYLWLGRFLAQPSGRDLFSGDDVLLAYSAWIASIIERKHNVKCGVLYPPVPGAFTEIPFYSRNDDFVCLGRISEEKRLERVLQILGKVRARGYAVRLRLVGGFGATVYSRTIQTLVQELPWVVLEGSVSEQSKIQILTSSRYGIHGAQGEGFGIAIAEMVKAGCIAFAPAEGGPAEILSDPALLYRDDDDALEKITAVLSDEQLQQKLLAHLRGQANKFSAERYMHGLRAAVGKFLRKYPDTTMDHRTCQ